MNICREAGCGGTIDADGYCQTCGTKFRAETLPAEAVAAGQALGQAGTSATPGSTRTPTIGAPMAPSRRTAPRTGGASLGAPAGQSRRTSVSARTASGRARVGAGLVAVAPTPLGDPALAIMNEEKIAGVLGIVSEDKRVCSSCGRPVGRSTPDRPGRTKGFCGNCRTPFDFTTNAPALAAGDLVADQYEIVGPLAHGGLGWIYLARDAAVSNRWVVLKGLLSSSDPDALVAAVAERQYLARVEHGNIVRIYNFVTFRGAGYIVMEFVGGESLNGKLKKRRADNGGIPDPLPVPEAIAYILATLPALGHLHGLGLLYNDMKPANIMAVGEDVKLIDLGAVIRADDSTAAVFGTDGFQAPEVAQHGVSVASDIYTVGRTLAVLMLNFVFHEGQYKFSLPTIEEEPLFAVHESLYRLLLRATAEAPEERFQSTDDMAEQLLGVLREIVAVGDGKPRPATSQRFSGDQLPNLFAELGEKLDVTARSLAALPAVSVDMEDPAAPFVTNMPRVSPTEVVRLIDAARAAGSVVDSLELKLRKAAALIEGGGDPSGILGEVAAGDPWEWRVDWYRGRYALAIGRAEEGAGHFSAVWTELPGELAPKQALAMAAEMAGDHARASSLYERVLTIDDSFVSAHFGLARCCIALGDRSGAVRAYERVPTSSAVYIDAQIAATRTRTVDPKAVTAADIATANATVDRLLLDPQTRAELQTEVLQAALIGLQNNSLADPALRVFGHEVSEADLRLGLERAYRERARAVTDPAERVRLVDLANQARPLTLI